MENKSVIIRDGREHRGTHQAIGIHRYTQNIKQEGPTA